MNVLFHRTPWSSLTSILEIGLHGHEDRVDWSDGTEWVLDWYGFAPVFLSTSDSRFMQMAREDHPDQAELEIDVRGVPLGADLASLVDHGARYDPDGYMTWREGRMPEALAPFVDEQNAIEISSLLDPDTDVAKAAIQVTGTCVVEVIEPGRIMVLKPVSAPKGPTP